MEQDEIASIETVHLMQFLKFLQIKKGRILFSKCDKFCVKAHTRKKSAVDLMFVCQEVVVFLNALQRRAQNQLDTSTCLLKKLTPLYIKYIETNCSQERKQAEA